MELLLWLGKWYVLSAGLFLIVFLICWVTYDNRLMNLKQSRVYGVAFCPVVNSIFVVCTSLFLMLTYAEKIIQYYREIKYDKQFNEMIRKYCNDDVEGENYL